jgi:hypothetical protein
LGPGVLIEVSTTRDSPDAHLTAWVWRHWSGKHRVVVDGINQIALVWSERERLIPRDCRVVDKPNDGSRQDGHFGTMVRIAERQVFTPECVLFDRWHASVSTLR